MDESRGHDIAKLDQIRADNHQVYARLTRLGQTAENVGTARHEHFINQLVKWGVITEDQMLDFDLAWEKKLNDMLRELEVNVMAQLRRQREAQQKSLKTPPKGLITPSGFRPVKDNPQA